LKAQQIYGDDNNSASLWSAEEDSDKPFEHES
jgi:hypothetical protein